MRLQLVLLLQIIVEFLEILVRESYILQLGMDVLNFLVHVVLPRNPILHDLLLERGYGSITIHQLLLQVFYPVLTQVAVILQLLVLLL